MRRIVSEGVGHYHLMSRTVGGEALFGVREKEVLRKMIWQVAEFSGIRVVTYAIMKNHFHVLVEVPGEREVSDRELVRRFRKLYPKPTPWQPISAEILAKYLARGGREGAEIREKLLERMHDISWFMKTVKHRFTRWYNRSCDRFGTIWAERFKSVLVEGDSLALKTVSAYIDLNAVRSGLVENPKDYRFCGYGEASGGGRLARAGLRIIDADMAGYRQTLYGSGAGAKDGKKAFDREAVRRVLEVEKGKVPLDEMLRCRVRYFTDGIAIGRPDYVERVCRDMPGSRSRPRRPHEMKGADWGGLTVATGLRKGLFG